MHDQISSLEENERKVWNAFYKDIHSAPNVIVETIGLDWHLEKIFEKLKDRPKITIALVGNAKVIEKRLRERQHKRRLPMAYNTEDEIATIYYVLDELEENPELADHIVDVTDKDINDVYKIVTSQINSFRITNT